MLAMDERRLWWCGIDLRARWRRRVAVLVTYAVFGLVVWMHPWQIRGAMWVFWFFGVQQMWALTIGKELGKTAQRLMSLVVTLMVTWLLWERLWKADPITEDLFVAAWVATYSVLARGRLVAGVMKKGWASRQLSGKTKKLESLDDFAMHFYGESFASLTEERQVEVGRMYRMSPMGEWVKPGSGRFPLVEDERLQGEDDALRARAHRWTTWTLAASVVAWSYVGLWHRQVPVEIVLAYGWTMLVLAFTLREALVLWSEPWPDEVNEMKLVEREVI